MNRKKILDSLHPEVKKTYENIEGLHGALRNEFNAQFDRSLPFADEMFDRWERAQYLGFGEGASVYDSVYVLGKVKIGEKTWVGPFVMLDGSGGMEIGSYCMISSGVHIYTHDTVKWALSSGKHDAERASVKIGDNCYIGSKSMITKGVEVGHHSVVGAYSFVNKSIPPYSIAVGVPARIIGRTVVTDDEVRLEYFDK